MQLKHQYLKSSWQQMYKAYSRADKERNYFSSKNREMDIMHDRLFKKHLLDKQAENIKLDNTALGELSGELYKEARRKIEYEDIQENCSEHPLAKSILELEPMPQTFLRANNERYVYVIGTFSDKGLDEDDLEFMMKGLAEFEPTYYESDECININMFTIARSMIVSEEALDQMTDIFRKRIIRSLVKASQGTKFEGLLSELPSYTLSERIKDWYVLNFKI